MLAPLPKPLRSFLYLATDHHHHHDPHLSDPHPDPHSTTITITTTSQEVRGIPELGLAATHARAALRAGTQALSVVEHSLCDEQVVIWGEPERR